MTIDEPQICITPRQVELERADAARKIIEEAVKQIEQDNCNPVYKQALNRAIRIIRKLKPD